MSSSAEIRTAFAPQSYPIIVSSVSIRPNVPVPAMTLVVRYLYSGAFPQCKTNTAIDENLMNQLPPLVALGSARPNLPILTIIKVYQSKCLARSNEALIALAYCIRQNVNPDLRKLAYDEAATLIDNQSDFLKFIKYCFQISTYLQGNGMKGMGHGLRRVVKNWYGKYTNVELANMFAEHRQLNNLSHKDIVALAHLKTNQNLRATQQSAHTESTSAAATAAATIENYDEDRKTVFSFLFNSGHKYLNSLNEHAEPLGEGTQRIKHLQIFKTNENTVKAVKQILEHGFSIEQTPSHLLERIEIWDALLPTLSYRKLLEKIIPLKFLTFLNNDKPFAIKYAQALGDLKKCDKEQPEICPIYVYLIKQLYIQNYRYLGKTKSSKYTIKLARRNRSIEVNQGITGQLCLLFEHRLLNSKPVTANFFITIDLRCGNAKKTVLRNKTIKVLEAMTLLAYSIIVREKKSSLFTFTEKKDELTPLHNYVPKQKDNITEVLEYYQKISITKTIQSLATPIAEATRSKNKVDLFLVIVDSVARFSRQGQVPLAEFNEYKTKFNPMAKYLVVNLCRPKPDLLLDHNSVDTKGFFEFCGFNDNLPKLLYALGKNCFS